jgi:hypothetical protein
MSFRVDVVGTSFWAYFLHLPMLASHPQACHGYFAYADNAIVRRNRHAFPYLGGSGRPRRGAACDSEARVDAS